MGNVAELTAISPIDGRYRSKVAPLAQVFSEYGLIKNRLRVEIKWFESLANNPQISEVPPLTQAVQQNLNKLIEDFDQEQALEVKRIEKQTNHDVKAIEYYLKAQFNTYSELQPYAEFIHFACTSEDINNLAYALMIQQAHEQFILPQLEQLSVKLHSMASQYANLAMLARTHGQPATPTTLGKEIINVLARLDKQRLQLAELDLQGKINGAVGNYNAHIVAYPEVDWAQHCRAFVESLNLNFNPYTTQIEPHDFIAETCHQMSRINTLLMDYARDVWSYISLGYFTQKLVANEVGSSTMPHKINPIDFENAEGNLGLANALLTHFAEKLPLSRWQRDLTDSTVLRNLGVAYAHSYLAYASLLKGQEKLGVDRSKIQCDLDDNWSVLAEPIQTCMRRYGLENPYEQLKQFTRGQKVTQAATQQFIESLKLPQKVKQRLVSLSPETYTGLACELTEQYPHEDEA